VPKPAFSIQTQRIFENGHGVHARLEKELDEAGILVRSEVPLACPEHNMKGHTDGIGCIELGPDGAVCVILEIKSIGQKGWDWIVGKGTKWSAPHGPDKKHIWQVQLYMWMSGLVYSVIIYENKNTQERAYYTIKRDLVLITETLLPKVDLVNEHVAKGTLPLRDAEHMNPGVDGKSPFECQWCDFRAVCELEETYTSAGKLVDLLAMGAAVVNECP
jgi:hypothetical protein